jgi:hypothetical protein
MIDRVTERLPGAMAEQVSRMYEFRMGVHRVGVWLANGTQFDDVLVSAGSVTRVIGQDTVPFDVGDVIAVFNQADLPLPPGP